MLIWPEAGSNAGLPRMNGRLRWSVSDAADLWRESRASASIFDTSGSEPALNVFSSTLASIPTVVGRLPRGAGLTRSTGVFHVSLKPPFHTTVWIYTGHHVRVSQNLDAKHVSFDMKESMMPQNKGSAIQRRCDNRSNQQTLGIKITDRKESCFGTEQAAGQS